MLSRHYLRGKLPELSIKFSLDNIGIQAKASVPFLLAWLGNCVACFHPLGDRDETSPQHNPPLYPPN